MERKGNILISVTDDDIVDGTVKIPFGITEIEEGAFIYCFSLMNINLPTSVIRIGADAFFCAKI